MLEVCVRGRLRSMSLPVLLRWASADRKTGILSFDKGPISKKISLSNGTIVSSSSNDPREYLGQFLLSQRLITEEQLRNAMEMQKKSRMMLGKLLLEAKVIREEDLMRLLTRKAEETIYSLFLWEDGEFQFLEGDVARKAEVPISLKIEDILLEGNRRYETLRRIRRDFPTDDVVLVRTGAPPPAKLLAQPMVRQVFDLADGSRSLADICLELHAPEFSVSWVLHQLFEKGHLGFAKAPAAAPPPRDEATGVLVEQAKAMLSKGEFEPSLVLLERLRGENSQNPELADLLNRAEAAFIDWIHGSGLSPDQVLVLNRTLNALTAEKLTAREGFIVSRLTGDLDVESLVNICPLREVEVLRILKRLRDRGIVTVRERPAAAEEEPAEPTFNRKGWGVGWVKADVLFDTQGVPRAFIKNGAVFRFDGSHLGQFEEGFFRDRAGHAVAFLRGASGGPHLPTVVAPASAPKIPRVPTIPLDELVPPDRASPSLSWSQLEFDNFLAGR